MTAVPMFRPRRSCLYMPGANARALEKATTLPADVVVLDLEDAVAPAAKEEARERVCDAVAARRFGTREVVVRINALSTPWGRDDLIAVARAAPDAILMPKVGDAAALQAVDDALRDAGAPAELALWAMIETPLGVLNCASIAALATTTQLTALVAGSNDLAKDLRLPAGFQRDALHVALSTIVMAARAFGLAAIDGVCNAIGDDAALRRECDEGRALGFDGKSLIHPSQLEAANAVFSPEPRALEQAHAIIAAFEQPENVDRGVIEMDGRMVERLHLEEAQRLVAIDEAIRQTA